MSSEFVLVGLEQRDRRLHLEVHEVVPAGPSDGHVAKPSVIIDRAGIFLTPVDVGCGRRIVGEVFVTCADARFSPGCLVPVISAAALFRGTALGCVLVLDVSNGYTGKSERNTDLASRAPLRPSLDAALALFLEK